MESLNKSYLLKLFLLLITYSQHFMSHNEIILRGY